MRRAIVALVMPMFGAAVAALAASPEELDTAGRVIADCIEGKGEACFDLGSALYLEDPGAARAYFDEGCEHGYGPSCQQAGMMWLGEDAAKSSAQYRAGCDRGWMPACVGAGRAATSAADRVRFFQKACDGAASYDALDGAADGCTLLGLIAARGEGVQKNDPVAVALFERGCALGDELGCEALGDMKILGRGTNPDNAGARAMWAKACDAPAGRAEACAKVQQYDAGRVSVKAVPPVPAATATLRPLTRPTPSAVSQKTLDEARAIQRWFATPTPTPTGIEKSVDEAIRKWLGTPTPTPATPR